MLIPKRNICIYTARDFPYGVAAENFVRMMSLGLYENGVSVEVVRFRGRLMDSYNDTPISCKNFFFSSRPGTELGKFFEWIILPLWTPLFLISRRLHKGKEIIILYGIEYANWGYPFMLSSKLLNLNCYRIITDKYPESTIIPVFWKKLKLFLYRLQQKKVDRKLSGLIVLTNRMKQHCITNGTEENKIVVIPHFVHVESELPEDQTRNHEDFIIGYSGNTDTKNGTDYLILSFWEVLKSRNNAKLWIIGKLNSSLITLAKELSLTKTQIYFTGFLEAPEIREKMKQCHLLVNPRINTNYTSYGFSTKLAEYLSTGKPVITNSEEINQLELINKKNIITFDPLYKSSLAEKIIWVTENYAEAERIGFNGKSWATENLDYRKNALKVKQFIISD